MDDKENCIKFTRLAPKKRAAAEEALRKSNKKRQVLGDITSDFRLGENQKPKGKHKRYVKKGTETKGEEKVKEKENADPQLCGAYASDIYQYLRNMEMDVQRRPCPDYLKKVQKEVNASMRGILVDWLVDVAEEFKLLSDTLYLAVSHIDRFLSQNAITRRRLQLVGVSSMLIAAKYGEITPPRVDSFCYMTDHTYTKGDVVNMETDVLKSLNFEMGNPTVKTFLRRFTRIALEDYPIPNLQLEFLGCYLGELSLLDYSCVKFLPSLVAASAIFLARFTLRPTLHPWNLSLQRHSGYKAADLKECVGILHSLQLSETGKTLIAIREKYKQYKFKCVSTLSSPSEIPETFYKDIKGGCY